MKDKLLTQKEQSRGSNLLQHAELTAKCSYSVLLYLLMWRDPGARHTGDRRWRIVQAAEQGPREHCETHLLLRHNPAGFSLVCSSDEH